MVRRHLPSLERLRALREVARLGGFSAAADTLGLTQPAVSNQIRQLEQQLGTRLLERIGKASKPTPEGLVLIAAASRVFAELETAIDEIPACVPTSRGRWSWPRARPLRDTCFPRSWSICGRAIPASSCAC